MSQFPNSSLRLVCFVPVVIKDRARFSLGIEPLCTADDVLSWMLNYVEPCFLCFFCWLGLEQRAVLFHCVFPSGDGGINQPQTWIGAGISVLINAVL